MVRKTLSLFALFTIVLASQLAGQSLPFKDGSFQQIQRLSSEKQQPFLFYMFKYNSKEHKKMLRKTWANKQVRKYLKANFQVGRVNVFSGKKDAHLVQKYQVFKLPTTLVFTHEGKLIGKIQGFAAPGSFRSILDKHKSFVETKLEPELMENPSPQIATTSGTKSAQAAPSISEVHTRVASQSATSNQSASIASTGSSYRSAPARQVSRGQANLHLEVPGMHEFSLNLKKAHEQVREQSLGLLIGSYTSYKQLKQMVARFQKVWKGRMWVFAEEVNQIPVYKLVLGDYASREEAEIYANVIYKIDKSNPSILDLNQLIQ